MLTLLEGSSEDLPVEAMRDYLNGLVEESVSRKSEQVRLVLEGDEGTLLFSPLDAGSCG